MAIALPALERFAGTALEPRGDYEAVDFLDRDFTGQAAPGAAFRACHLGRCRLDGLSMPRSRMSECLVEDVSAVTIDLADSVWRDTLLVGGRVGALSAPGGRWSDVRVQGAKLDFVDLSGARLSDVVFEACVIGELDLGDAQARSVRFIDSHVGELNVEGAKLAGLDLAGAALQRLRGVESLRGAIVSREQLVDLAPLLAAHLGIEVRDD